MKTRFITLLASQIALAAMLVSGSASADTLTLYTSQPEADAAKTVDAFKAAHPGTEVNIYRSGTSDIMTKLAAEFAANSPQADVLLIADAVSMELLKKDDRLLAYPEAKLDGIEADAYDNDKTYFGSKLITTASPTHRRGGSRRTGRILPSLNTRMAGHAEPGSFRRRSLSAFGFAFGDSNYGWISSRS